MKNFFVILSVVVCPLLISAQTIERLSKSEISENETPRAVAYNFVLSIINEDYLKMYSLMTAEFRSDLNTALVSENMSCSQLFSPDNMHDIVGMRPVVKMGYDVVITNSWILNQNDVARYSENYVGLPAFSVSFNCVDAYNNFYDDTYGAYDTTARVLLVKQEGEWKVFGFK